MSNVPTEVILTGTTAAPPPARALRAGSVRVLFTGGDLRRVRLGETELASRVYVAVRDPDWNTLPGFLRGGEERAVRGGTATVTLNPYGVGRLDIRHE